jgi:hypothetical protein
MHFTQLLSISLLAVATGVSAAASPNPNVDFAPKQVGRRHSRKAIQRRHWHHHHHNSDSAAAVADPTIEGSSPAVPEPTTTEQSGDDGEDCDTPDVVTIYTTITLPADGATPTESDSPAPTESDATPTESSAPSTGSNSPSNDGAVIQATGSPCGDPNAVPEPAPTSGPNGDENWLNCGVDGDGWVPPPVTLDNLIYRDLAVVLTEDGNPFSACSDYLPIFQEMEAETGIPTIFLASIALQESGCNPTVTGGAGEIGMMQITSEKCPSDGSDCFDAATNIGIGARYFKTVIDDQCQGNVACAMGAYNGWQTGLTVASANNYAICAQHNNLDYLQNVFNWYLQGKGPSGEVGIYHNTC